MRLPLTAQAMSMSRERASALAVIMIMLRSNTTPRAHNSGLPVTMDRVIATMAPMRLLLTGRGMSMLRDTASGRAPYLIKPRLNTTPRAHNSGLPAMMGRVMAMTMPMPFPLTAQAMSLLRDTVLVQAQAMISRR